MCRALIDSSPLPRVLAARARAGSIASQVAPSTSTILNDDAASFRVTGERQNDVASLGFGIKGRGRLASTNDVRRQDALAASSHLRG